MKTTLSRFRILFLGCLLVTSCAQDPQLAKRRFFESGNRYFEQKKYGDAIIEYSRALQKDARFGEAHLRLADAYLANDNQKNALLEYIRAADLLPDNTEAQIKAGRLLVNEGFFSEAKTRARSVLKRDPTNVDALLVLGNALVALRSVDDAIGVLGKALQVDPERAGVHGTLGVFELAQGNRDLAEAAFKKAVSLAPDSADAHLNLGTFYRASGRLNEAERSLKRAYELQPQWVRVNQALFAFYQQLNRPADAEPYLKAAADILKDAKSRYALADYYTGQGRYADALKTLEALASEKGNYAAATTKIATLEYAFGHRVRADQVISEVLAREPQHAGALTVKARLLLAENKPLEALQRAKQAVNLDLRSADAQLALARIHLALNNVEEARKALNETLKLDPHSLPAQLELAELHRARDELDTALEHAQQAVNDHRESAPARIALIRVLLVREADYPRAENEIRILLSKHPKFAPGYAYLGTLWLGKKNKAAARRAFERALELDSASPEALVGLVLIDLSYKKPAVARSRVEAFLAKSPEAPAALLMAAKLYGITGNGDKVEETLKRALEADPSNPETYDLLGRIYLSQGRLPEAKKQFTDIARLDPQSVSANTMLGWLCYAEKDVAEAQKWWEKAIQADWGAAAAANNLAWLYAEGRGNLDVALQLAQTARAKFPTRPEVVDTLGWVYYKKALYKQAVFYVQQSVDQDQTNPLYHYHLGMAYAQMGEDGKARRALQRALNIQKDFDGAVEARRMLATLVF
jgi:tetratricopeptide (TPR) repeat protein